MDCQQSGLSDYEWCSHKSIKIGTFYNWVSRLKRTDGIMFPKGVRSATSPTVLSRQEIVRVKLDNKPVPFYSVNYEYNVRTTNIPPDEFRPQTMKVENLTFPRENPNAAITPRKQEVVKLDVFPTPAQVHSTNDQYNNSIAINDRFKEAMPPVMKVNLPCGSIDIPNGTDPTLLETTLRILGGFFAR